MAIQWTQALAVGNEDIDAPHRELFRRAGRLLQDLNGGAPAQVVATVEHLLEHAVPHFAREEAWMREAAFAGYVRHRAEHERFVADLRAIAADHRRGDVHAAPALAVSRWVAEWLRLHVSGNDVELARFLAGEGGARSAG